MNPFGIQAGAAYFGSVFGPNVKPGAPCIKIKIACGAMGVRDHLLDGTPLTNGQMITDELPSKATLVLTDGNTVDFTITFPQTLIDKTSWKTRMVKPTPTTNGEFIYNGMKCKLSLALPEEPCVLVMNKWIPFLPKRPLEMTALAIIADATLMMGNILWTGKVGFPNVRSLRKGKGWWEVDPCLAEGSVIILDKI